MLKSRLRRFVVWSARPPFDAVYRRLYRAVTSLAIHRLRQHACVEAIYLCRGCATGDILPGVSDIDLVIVTRDDGTFVLAASPEYKEIAHNQFEEDGSTFNASPIVSGGRLFLRSDRFLYCIGKG